MTLTVALLSAALPTAIAAWCAWMIVRLQRAAEASRKEHEREMERLKNEQIAAIDRVLAGLPNRQSSGALNARREPDVELEPVTKGSYR